MKNLLASFVLIPAFVLNSLAWAEDAGSVEAVGPSSETTGQSVEAAPFTIEAGVGTSQALNEPVVITSLGSDAYAALLSTAGALLTTGFALMKWRQSETRRRYADAASEARTRLTAKDPAPIRNATPNGSLQQVAGMERLMLEQNHPDIKLNETQVAALIIAHNARLEAS